MIPFIEAWDEVPPKGKSAMLRVIEAWDEIPLEHRQSILSTIARKET